MKREMARESCFTTGRFAGAHVKHRLIGDAKAPETLAAIRSAIAAEPGPVMVFLDDWHDGEHVYAELQLYSQLVQPAAY